MSRLGAKWSRGLSFLVALAACGCSSPVTVQTPASAGSYANSISLQVTAWQKDEPVQWNSADFAELVAPHAKREFSEAGFELKGAGAERHVIVHVRAGGRGTGAVRSYCQLEAYVYEKWPGRLKRWPHKAQTEMGALIDQQPLVHLSFDLEHRGRSRTATQAIPDEGARLCAERAATELAKLRSDAISEKAAPRAPVVETKKVEPEPEPEPTPAAAPSFEVIHKLAQGPGNLTVSPAGRLFVSLHQFFQPKHPVMEVTEGGALEPFAVEANLDSVLGIQSDENGVIWMLDNGMKSTGKRRLVGWHSVRDKIVADIDLNGVTPPEAFINDLVIDLDHETAYIADPARGELAALIVVDLKEGKARRLLQGHKSVVAEEIDLVVDETPLEIMKEDGTSFRPHVGVNPIAADANNEWLYFGPMHATSLYRVRTEHLRDLKLNEEALRTHVERFSDKPITDGISMDHAGNIYLGHLEKHAIVRISPDGDSEIVAEDPQLSWIDAFSFGPDGKLYTLTNQLHLSAPLHRGQDATKPPFLILTLPTETGGVIGR